MTTDISVVRWDPSQGPGSEYIDEYEYDGGNSSSRLFERSRIKALAGNYELILIIASSASGFFHLLLMKDTGICLSLPFFSLS